MDAVIRLASLKDSNQITEIYRYYVDSTPVSFESQAPDVRETIARMENILEWFPWLVCDVGGEIAGYAYGSAHRARYHYRWSVDVTVYVANGFHRQGIGNALYTSLLRMLPIQGYVMAHAGITLPNSGSVGLHERHGFQHLGTYQNVGFKLGQWHDVGWWELLLMPLPEQPPEIIPVSQACLSSAWQEGINFGTTSLLSR